MTLANKYDLMTRWLHAALALGVTAQLVLSAVMRVPPGPGLGVHDWHRAAFELHAQTGIVVTIVCALHWLWISLPVSHPGLSYLFPWLRADARADIKIQLKMLLRLRVPSSQTLSPLVGSIHGLGFAAVTGSAVCGLINYFGYFMGAPIPTSVLHVVGRLHTAFGYLLWVFVIAHTGMALGHWGANRLRCGAP